MAAWEARHPAAQQLSRFERRLPWALAFVLLWFVLRWVPRDRDAWIFGADNGRGFSGHAKWLYLYALAHRPQKRVTWVTLDRGVLGRLRSQGFPCVRADSAEGLAAMLRAGTIFMTHGVWDFLPPFVAGARWIQLWHGVPLKTMRGLSRADLLPWYPLLPWWRRGADALLAPHPALADALARIFGRRPHRVIAAGGPRLDGLHEVDPTAPDLERDAERLRDGGRLVVYLPTWRPWLDPGRDPDPRLAGMDPTHVDRALEQMGAYLVIKPHPYMDGARFARRWSACRRVRVLDAATWNDPAPLLRRCDVLVTDYSSVFYDALVLDVPVVFLAPDLERAQEEDVVPEDYEARVPGPTARDWRQVLKEVRRFLGGRDAYAEARGRAAAATWVDAGPGQSARLMAALEENGLV